MLAKALAELRAHGLDGGAADRVAIEKLGTDRLVGETAHGQAAAAIEALIRRQAEFAGTCRQPPERAQRDHAAPVLRPAELFEVEVGRCGSLNDHKGRVAVARGCARRDARVPIAERLGHRGGRVPIAQRFGRRDGQRRAQTVQWIVERIDQAGAVVFGTDRHSDQRVIARHFHTTVRQCSGQCGRSRKGRRRKARLAFLQYVFLLEIQPDAHVPDRGELAVQRHAAGGGRLLVGNQVLLERCESEL